LQSEDFGTTWAPNNATVSTNAIASPDGNTTADKIALTNTVGVAHNVLQSFAKAASAIQYNFSVFAKAGEYTFLAFRIDDGGANGVYTTFNLSGGTISTAITATGAGFTATSSAIKAYPNGWYRVDATFTSNAAVVLRIIPTVQDANGNPFTYTFTATTGSGLYLWGAQLEAGAFATSYIPTAAATVTRAADVLTYPYAGNADGAVGTCSAYLSTQWTSKVAIAVAFTAGKFVLDVEGGTSTTIVINDGTNVADKTGLTDMNTGLRKRASSWSASPRIAAYGDSAAPATNAAFSGTMGATKISIGCNDGGSQQWCGTIRDVRIWQRVLSDSQIASIK